MGLIDTIAARFGYAKAGKQYPKWILDTAAVASSSDFNPAMWRSQAELYQRLSWVQIAVSMIANAIATVPFSVKQMQGEDEEDLINHDFERLLMRPNPLMSRYEFLNATASYRALTGNAYWWLNRAGENAPPSELWTVPSHRIKPVPDGRMYLKGYMYDPGDGRQIPLEPWEIVHFKKFNPLDPFVGLSPIEALATIAQGDLKMQDWNTKLFGENNARLPGILAFADVILDSDWELIKTDVVDSAKKRQMMMLRNAGKGGVEWMQAAMSQKDMEFLAGRKFNKEEIFGIYAPGLASMLDTSATEANAKTGRATFNEYGIWPVLVETAEKITNEVLPVYGENLRGEFDDVRYVDRQLELTEQAEFSKTHTIDEIRQKYYGEGALGDARGELIPVQIGPVPVPLDFMQAGSIDELEEPEPVVEEPFIFPPVPDQAAMPEEMPEPDLGAIEAEMKAWRSFAIKRLGKDSRPFECKHISEAEQTRIREALKTCKMAEDVDRVFGPQEYLPLIEKIEAGMRTLMEAEA